MLVVLLAEEVEESIHGLISLASVAEEGNVEWMGRPSKVRTWTLTLPFKFSVLELADVPAAEPGDEEVWSISPCFLNSSNRLRSSRSALICALIRSRSSRCFCSRSRCMRIYSARWAFCFSSSVEGGAGDGDEGRSTCGAGEGTAGGTRRDGGTEAGGETDGADCCCD